MSSQMVLFGQMLIKKNPQPFANSGLFLESVLSVTKARYCPHRFYSLKLTVAACIFLSVRKLHKHTIWKIYN